MDQFEALVRLNQLRRKSKDLSLKWIILSSLTCFLLLFGSFNYNWLNSYVNPLMHSFSRDLFPWGAGSSYNSGFGSGFGSSLFGGGAGYGNSYGSSYGLGGGNHHGGGYGGGYGNGYGSSMNGGFGDMISTVGPFSGCLETRTRYDFFGFQCRTPTESFLKFRHRASGTLLFCEFLLILGNKLLFLLFII